MDLGKVVSRKVVNQPPARVTFVRTINHNRIIECECNECNSCPCEHTDKILWWHHLLFDLKWRLLNFLRN